MIKDSDIKKILQSGPATISQISHILIDEYPTVDRTRIYRDVNVRTHSLVKYRMVITIQHDGREYFALPENTVITNPDIGPRPHHKISAYINDLPDGTNLTYREIMARFGVSKRTAYNVLNGSPNLRKSRNRPAIFVKGA